MKNLLATLTGAPRSSAKAGFAVPPGLRVYAVGDIHGRYDLFQQMLDAIEADVDSHPPDDVRLVLLGDLVDRGPQSAEVVQAARQLCESSDSVRVLMGNHEEVFLRVLDGDADSVRFFLKIGGGPTLMSYGITDREMLTLKSRDLVDLVIERVPRADADFLRGLENVVRYGDVVFVHAGVRPGVPIDEQKLADLRWIRGDFLNSRSAHGALVVHGHNISEEVEDHPNRVGIDTGACASGKLSILALEGTTRRVITIEGAPDPQWASAIAPAPSESLIQSVKRLIKRD